MKLTPWLLLLAAGAGACHNPPTPEESLAAARAAAPPQTGPAPLVTGTVLDVRTGKPVAGARVRGPGGIETRSDARGRFVLRGLTAGVAGELVATTEAGLSGKNQLRALAPGPLEVVVYLR